MLADFEFKFDQHEITIRRAEANAQRMAALTPERPARSDDRPTSRLSTLLRRIAGTAATA
jgi:hypothetical protein